VSSAAHDSGSRWRAFLARWREDFSELPEACRQAVPILERTYGKLERTYGKLIAELSEHLCQSGEHPSTRTPVCAWGGGLPGQPCPETSRSRIIADRECFVFIPRNDRP
jgi:hypothetical protein